MQMAVFPVMAMMAVSLSDDSVSSDGSVFSDCSVFSYDGVSIDGSVCIVEECCKFTISISMWYPPGYD